MADIPQVGLDKVSSRALWNVKEQTRDHKGMLNAPALKKRLAQAMKERPEVKQARIAEATKKSPQAVSAWVKTGQIDPAHFPILSKLFGKPLEYWYGTDRVGEPAAVSYLPSQPTGRQDLSVRFARAAADKVAARIGIDRASDEYLVVFDEIHDSIKRALESDVPDNRVDLVGKLSARTPEETSNADRRDDGENGDHTGGENRGQARAPAGTKRTKPKT